MIVLFLFLFGSAIGSFLTVVIDRLPRNISVIHGRSFCENCKHTLAWNDLIPVFSYILLRGRCRYCKKSFGPHYVFMEAIVGLLFIIVYFSTIGSTPVFEGGENALAFVLLYRILVVCILFVIFFIDFRHSIIPFSSLLFLGALGIINLTLHKELLLQTLATAAAAFLFFLLIHLITRGKGMGFGDVLLAFVMGLLLGFPTTVVAVYIAFLTGAVVSLILLLGGKKKLKSAIPFGPFLVGGTFLCLLWGPQLTHGFLVLLRIV